MEEKHIFFAAGPVKLEGLFYAAKGNNGVVITHPHPIYGGNMESAVVDLLSRTYQLAGYSTLRFNFRGVGNSGGYYDQGEGEQQDVQAALEYLVTHCDGSVDLVGYSFGAWVNARALATIAPPNRVIMISPPVSHLDFSGIATIPRLRLVVVGDRDQFAPLEEIISFMPKWNPRARLEVIENADHFYVSALGTLEAIFTAFLANRG
ncbi:MAG: alpha/beta hydrolase [Deltaproteobacteria bacterium]|nr:alpha/beta hydrolase [Deltaproteobacteria bacterium]MBW2071892.1 alpha/beta hydrolase [Deltaproteobacteria bacterium]